MSAKPFDPFTATFEEATSHVDALAISRWGHAQKLTIDRSRFEADPLAGVYICAIYDLVMPDWLAAAFARGYECVKGGDAKSWDEGFGLPHAKGTQLPRLRFAMRTRSAIFNDVVDALRLDPTRAIDAGLFEEVGRRHGAGKTLAEELYREQADLLGWGAAKMKRADVPAKSSKLAGVRRKR